MFQGSGLYISVIAASFVTYCIYFDHSRRNNEAFRKDLLLQKKKIKRKEAKKNEEILKAKQGSLQEITNLVNKTFEDDPIPEDTNLIGNYLLNNLTIAKELSKETGKELESACHFFKALSVYSEPEELLGMMKENISDNIYSFVITMIAVKPPVNIVKFLHKSKSLPFEGKMNDSVDSTPIDVE